jgi:hypothetical protein
MVHRHVLLISYMYRMDRFTELVPRSRTLQKFVLRPHNVRVTLAEDEAEELLLLGGGGGAGDQQQQQQQLMSTPINDPLQAPSSASSSSRKSGGRRRPTARRKILSPLKGGSGGKLKGEHRGGSKAPRKPLASLGEGNSVVP